jgi:hypothetical protein
MNSLQTRRSGLRRNAGQCGFCPPFQLFHFAHPWLKECSLCVLRVFAFGRPPQFQVSGFSFSAFSFLNRVFGVFRGCPAFGVSAFQLSVQSVFIRVHPWLKMPLIPEKL